MKKEEEFKLFLEQLMKPSEEVECGVFEIIRQIHERSKCGPKKDTYRLDVRPLWKNNTEETFSKLAKEIHDILKEEFGFHPVLWEPTIKCFRFQAGQYDMSMKTIIALQAIGHNNGGYSLGISRVL